MADNPAEWQADVKAPLAADPTVVPEYTPLPGSRPHSQLNPADSASNLEYATAALSSVSASASCGDEGFTILKLLWTGLLAVVLPPAIIAAAALACGAAMLYGCGRILEGFGRTLAIGPEFLYRKLAAKRVKHLAGMLRGTAQAAGQQDVEAGAIAI